jgi:hypothetical protein
MLNLGFPKVTNGYVKKVSKGRLNPEAEAWSLSGSKSGLIID